MRLIYLIFLTVLLSSCGLQTAQQQDGGDTVAFRYAKRLTIVRYDGYTVATLQNPWKPGKILHQYVIVPYDAEVPHPLPEGTIIRTPLKRPVINRLLRSEFHVKSGVPVTILTIL